MLNVNIKIVTDSGQLIDYINAEDINIRMNRIADDMQDIEARVSEFSYTFKLPITKNNASVFMYAGTTGIRNSFKANPVGIKVFNNDKLLLEGQLELRSITADGYDCVFYSKVTQLFDSLKDMNLRDITNMPQIPWDYETTIRNHINAGYANCEETIYQFPLIFYNTYFCPTSVFTGLTDTIIDKNGTTNHLFQRDRDAQNYYYLINRSSIGENEMYFHQIPMALYLKPVVEYLLADVGWGLGGSFWNDEDVKKIIIPYVGDTDVYDRATYCDNGGSITGSVCSGGGNLMLDTAEFLPDVDAIDFLSDIIKLFNLYFTIDTQNKTISFETYDVMFGNKVNPYDVTNKLIQDTVVVSKVEDYDPSIVFDDPQNKRIFGDNQYIASTGTSASAAKYNYTTETAYDEVFNHVGTTDKQLKIGFAAPTVKRMYIRNEYNINDVNKSAGDHIIFLPQISKQVKEDSGNKAFNKKDSDSTAYNNESSIQYNGKPTLMYYYGVSTSDFQQKTPTIGSQSDYFFTNFDDVNQRIGFCSPFALRKYRGNINSLLVQAGLNPTGYTDNPEVILASYMQSIYLMLADNASTFTETGINLVLRNADVGDTIYTKYHQNKYKRYQQSELLQADMLFDDNDWRVMEINTPILYRGCLYSIVEIKNYNIVKHTAQVTFIKQL